MIKSLIRLDDYTYIKPIERATNMEMIYEKGEYKINFLNRGHYKNRYDSFLPLPKAGVKLMGHNLYKGHSY